MSTSEIADEYIAMRADHDVAEAATKTVAKLSIEPQGLVDALGAEILNSNRSNHEEMQKHRNDVLSYFAKVRDQLKGD